MGRRPPATAKRDANEPEIFAILRANGFEVWPMDIPVDALASYGGVTYLVEIKSGPKAKLTDLQKRLIHGNGKKRGPWKAPVEIIRSVSDATDFVRRVKHGPNDNGNVKETT